MNTERRVVDNRTFLFGLDELYRELMKRHERDELLRCARETTRALSVPPADVPIEGYYSEDGDLTEYFRLMRALQLVPKNREPEVATLAGFQRIREVTRSPIFGASQEGRYLLPAGRDVLTAALERTFPEWTVGNLTKAAYDRAVESSDFSLVALAALSRDPVVLAALRESVVLYSMPVAGCAAIRREPEYAWEVDPIIQEQATRFVDTFNELFGESLPRPSPGNAAVFWNASDETKVFGRCVRIGFDPSTGVVRHYHWAIRADVGFRLNVEEFWDTEIWTTERYRARSFASHGSQ
jgi:hypothetical protein